MRTTALEGLAICDPARAVARAVEHNASKAELAYLASMLKQLGTRLDRYVSPTMQTKATKAANA